MVYPKTPIYELERRIEFLKSQKEDTGKKLDNLDEQINYYTGVYLDTEKMIRSLAARLREAKKQKK